jgi:hypothetical protein
MTSLRVGLAAFCAQCWLLVKLRRQDSVGFEAKRCSDYYDLPRSVGDIRTVSAGNALNAYRRTMTFGEENMYPWFLFWAPQVHLPFGGSVAQRIDPNTSWFFDGIRREAGIAEVEKQIFDVASYGRQLGLIMEVLLSIVDEETIDAKKSAESLTRLKAVYRKIESVKNENTMELVDATVALLNKLRDSDANEFDRVLRIYIRHVHE